MLPLVSLAEIDCLFGSIVTGLLSVLWICPRLTASMNLDVVIAVLFEWFPPSVCNASQTRAAMMTSGKSALRKKRFTGSPA